MGLGFFFPIYLCKWFTRCQSMKLYILSSKNLIQSKSDESQWNEDGETIWNSSSFLPAWLFLIGKFKPLCKEVYKLGKISRSPLQNPSLLPPKKEIQHIITITVNSMQELREHLECALLQTFPPNCKQSYQTLRMLILKLRFI